MKIVREGNTLFITDSGFYEPAPIRNRRSRVVAHVFITLVTLAIICSGLAAWVN